jgi:hypothetical protein
LLSAEPVLDLTTDATKKISGFIAQHEAVGDALWALNFAIAPVQTVVSEAVLQYTSAGDLIKNASARVLNEATQFVQDQTLIDDPNRAASILVGGLAITALAVGGVSMFRNFASSGTRALEELTASDRFRAYRAGIDDGFNVVDRMFDRLIDRPSAAKWGLSKEGRNQGIVHFLDYGRDPEMAARLPSLEERLGVDPGTFAEGEDGFDAFTDQALRVTETGEARQLSEDKMAYFLEGAENPSKGVVVVTYQGQLQTMYPAAYKQFLKTK